MAYFHDPEYETELFYEVRGEGIPFLLIHGWAIDHFFLMNALEPVFDTCKTSYQRIYVDVPGMGESKPGYVKNGDGIVKVLMHLMDELCPEEPFYIGGNSFGAALSRAILAKYPSRIRGAMLIVPSSGLGDRLPAPEGCFVRDDAFLKTLPEKDRQAFEMMNANLTKAAWERYEKLAYPSVLGNENNDFLHKVLKGTFSYDVNAMLKKQKYKGPVLILTAKYDTAVGYKAQFDWLEDFVKGTYVVLDGAGHNIHIDQPEHFEHTVAGWLASIRHQTG
ncbi:MAG: alpha/beta hydrolase [Lachnospiraceae bacterium]|nr:alpha/beta hydrolase [Lachnospiraceae bacterium]